VVICLERGADLHMAQLMPLPLIVSCFSKIQIGFTFLVPAHPGSPGKRAVKRVCVCRDGIFTIRSVVYFCTSHGSIVNLNHYEFQRDPRKGLGPLTKKMTFYLK